MGKVNNDTKLKTFVPKQRNNEKHNGLVDVNTLAWDFDSNQDSSIESRSSAIQDSFKTEDINSENTKSPSKFSWLVIPSPIS